MPKQVQHGFLMGKSMVGLLLKALSNINSILKRCAATDMTYFDPSKAFDSVPYNGLLHTLKTFSFGGLLL